MSTIIAIPKTPWCQGVKGASIELFQDAKQLGDAPGLSIASSLLVGSISIENFRQLPGAALL